MNRTICLAALLAATNVSAKTFTDPVVTEGANKAAAPIAALLSQVVGEIEKLVPHALLDHVVAAELSLRDLARSADARLVAWAGQLPSAAPDLAVLTTMPIDDPDDSSGYGWRDDPIRHTRRFHSGTDYRADPGTPVFAAGPGVVVFAGRQGGYGNVIYVDHGGGVITLYGHLRRIETKKDSAVAAGERIGQVGSTGRATGPHLHFEVRLDAYPRNGTPSAGRAVDSVTAMTVAAMEREAPEAGRLAAFALAPEIQRKAVDGSDRQRGNRHKTSRPERAGRTQRQQVLW